MENRTLAVMLAAAAVTASASSSLIGYHRADATEEDPCAGAEVCVELGPDHRIAATEFETTSCSASTTITHLRAYATARAGARGWHGRQHDHLIRLWTRESNWRWNASNPTSGAYGIPQSLPATKMATAGADWKTNPCTQIQWGLAYIDRRYDSPTKAWAFWQQNNWY